MKQQRKIPQPGRPRAVGQNASQLRHKENDSRFEKKPVKAQSQSECCRSKKIQNEEKLQARRSEG